MLTDPDKKKATEFKILHQKNPILNTLFNKCHEVSPKELEEWKEDFSITIGDYTLMTSIKKKNKGCYVQL